jgi:pimeloyl-ACP methyl ester carboxylesterase
MSIPYSTNGEPGPQLFFLHANGYPPECYQPLISRLAERYSVISMRQRPLWPDSKPEDISDWYPLTDDFLRFLKEHQTKATTCIGHSVGGIVALRAALRQPQLFKSLILIDPVLFPPYIIHCWRVIYTLGLSYQLHPLVRATRARRRHFDDLDRLFTGYRHKKVFRYMDDMALHAYIKGIACKDEQGYELCYSAEWEMRIYTTSVWNDMDLWHNLPGLKIPLLLIRGEETDTFWASTARRIQRKVPATRVVSIPRASHLVPLERPNEVYHAIEEFLKENS